MEINKVEATAVADLVAQTNEAQMVELGEMQLALVGGGSGEVILG